MAVKLTQRREKNCLREEEIRSPEKKKEALVLVLHQIPAKHTERVHMQLSPILVA